MKHDNDFSLIKKMIAKRRALEKEARESDSSSTISEPVHKKPFRY